MSWEKRILHLGLGRFHRGHQAVYYQKMKDLGDPRWGVVSMSMRSPEARDQLRKVNLKYPVLELSAKESKTTWVESIREALDFHQDFPRVLEIFQDPQLEMVTLTITEKGYDLDGAGKLDFSKSQIIQDLSHPESPKSAIGLLALGLRLRRLRDRSPLTVISCDNLRDNGKKLQHAVEEYVQKLNWLDDHLWISQKIKFPNTMVDRIVPSLRPEKVASLEKDFSLSENSELIGTETFTQWVIEDTFAQPRPAWEKVGVEFVKEVRPYEEMKLKLLNASHSYLAYAGLNRGYQFVHEAIADKELRQNVLKLYEEVTPTLVIPSGFDLELYKKALVSRFENSQLPHQLKQIAMDGSQKLPQRIFPTIRTSAEKNLSHDVLLEVIREWIKYCSDLFGKGLGPEDPAVKHKSDLLWEGPIFTTLHHLPKLKSKIYS